MDKGRRGGNIHRGWLAGLKSKVWFKKPEEAEAAISASLPRAGYFFVATHDDLSQLDLTQGPKIVGLVAPTEIPHLYEPSFLSLIAAATTNETAASNLEAVRRMGDITLFMVPPPVTAALARLTADKPQLTSSTIETIMRSVMSRLESGSRYKEGGVRAAILILHGHALRAVRGKELYYWHWRNPRRSDRNR